MINLKKYNSFIFDFDGVILDSNNIKKSAIGDAVRGVLSHEQAEEFVQYFVNSNGVPREVKIAKYVPKDQYECVLANYEDVIENKLKSAELIPGVKNVIQKISRLKKDMIVLSGGTQTEVLQLLIEKGLASYFDGVYGGPKNKEENLQSMSLVHPVLYFGDSEVDYFVAKRNGFDFVFVYGASNIENWRVKVNDWKLVMSIKDFKSES